jgi:GNAT superfamily N-acetyltransferase
MSRVVDIVPAQVCDVDRLCAIDPRFAGDAEFRARNLVRLMAGMSWLALVSGEPVGYAVVTRYFFDYPFVELLFVREDYRRQGVGRALTAHCEHAHDGDRIFTSTNESNDAMRALMDAVGWRRCGRVDALDEGDPELFFVKFRGG